MWGVSLLLVLLAGGAAYYLKTEKAKTGGKGPATITVPTVAVTMGNLHRSIRISGTITAMNFAALLAPRMQGSRTGMNRGGDFGGVGGRGGGGQQQGGGRQGGGGAGPMGDFSLILMTLATPGAAVKTGDVVAEFDPQMQAQRLDDYKDTLVQTDNSIRKMLANLAARKEAHDQTVRAAKAAWDKAVLDLQTAPIRSQIDAEKYKLAVEEAAATYKELQAESALVDESQLAQIRGTQLNRNQSDIELKRAEVNVQKMSIKSPMSGIVVMTSIVRNGEFGQIREGDEVRPGQSFMQIVDPSSMVLNASVNQVDAEKLRLGMKAVIRLDAYPGVEMPGTLVGVGAMSTTSRFRAGYVGSIPVRLKIERIDPRLIPDLTGSAEIVLNSETNTLVAPRAALFEENGGSFVFVQGSQGWVRKPVELGLTNFITASIRSGVQKGDLIALQRPI
jgi:HlyD family secretion protein